MTNTVEIVVHSSSLGFTARVDAVNGPWAASKQDPFTAAFKAACTYWYGRINRKELSYDHLRSISVAHSHRGIYIATKLFKRSQYRKA